MLTAKILGTGSYLPDLVLKNTDFEKMVETSDEWITKRTGISERHIGTGIENWEMGVFAAQKALESAGAGPESIDIIIGTTVTPDYFYPSMANIIQWKLGAKNASCFDISAACSGFIVGADTAWQYIRSGVAKRVLVVSADAISKTIDFSDRSTCVLFGDGAGAVLFEASEKSGIINAFTASEADPSGFITCRALPPKNPFIKEGHEPAYPGLQEGRVNMNGRETYKFAVKALPASINKVLENTGFTLDDIKYFVPHQANLRIIQYVAEHMGIDASKMYVNIEKYGNTSSAALPIALDEMSRGGLLKPHDKIIIAAFGAGLNYGSILIEW